MVDAVAAAIEAARAQAANVPAPVTQMPTAAPVPVVLGSGRVKTLADAVETYVERPDLFIKVDEYGMEVGEVKLISEIEGVLNLADLKFPDVCRYTTAGQHTYLRTYDGVREVRTGKAWSVALDEAKRIDPKADTYPAVEYSIAVTKEIVNGMGKKAEVAIGQRVGNTTSRTGFDPVMKAIKEAAKLYGPEAVVNVKLLHEPRKKGSNSWGVIRFEVVGPVANS
jgi:hypothetical protein